MLRVLHEDAQDLSDFFCSRTAFAQRGAPRKTSGGSTINSSEQRLADSVVARATTGRKAHLKLSLPEINQETLAGMVRTTRSTREFFYE